MFGQSLLSAFGSAACTTDTDQLFATDVQTTSTATYQLNNATTSIPGNNYPGTPSNITYAAGKFGNAAVFNGGNSVIDISSSAINPASPYTISMWFNADTASTYEGLYTGISSSPVVGELTIVKASATILQTFSVATNGSNNLNANTVTIPTLSSNTWYNVVVIADRSLPYKSRVFINGVEGTNYTVGSASTNLLSTIKVGFADNNYFDGSIDQIRFFPSSLPQVAITALYNETTTTAQSASVDYQLANPNSIAYYKMSNATDQLGNYNGTATDVNFNTEGKFGFAGAFNGSSSRITSGLTSGLTGTYSVSAWFTQDNISTDTAHRELISYVDVDGSTGWWIGKHNNTSQWRILGVTGVSIVNMTAQAGWNHIAVVKNSSTVYVYLNGVEVTNFAFPGYWNLGSGLTPQFNIGTQYTGTSEYWDGKIDQIRIYDSALSAANVTKLYNEIECPAVAVTNAFNTVLWTGDGISGRAISVGFQPDMSWYKSRNNAYDHNLSDSVRGAQKQIRPNRDIAEVSATDQITAFTSTGLTLGSGGDANGGSNQTYVAWNWKAGGTAVSNTEGTTTSQVSANTNAGFSIVSYSGTGANATVGHGLSSAPQLILQKRYEAAANWFVYSQAIGNTKYINLDATGAAGSAVNVWNNTDPTDKVFSVSSFFDVNGSGISSIAYCFTSIPGYSKVGSYSGGSSGSSNVIVIGFKPRFLIVKRTDQAGDAWQMFDSTMAGADTFDDYLQANTSAAEASYNQREVNFTNNGFYWTYAESGTNISGGNYIFLAIA